jgi:hypothetical protein
MLRSPVPPPGTPRPGSTPSNGRRRSPNWPRPRPGAPTCWPECAGTALGFAEDGQDAARYRQIAELCIAAGADRSLIGRWIAVGRERAAAARARPHTGPRNGIAGMPPELSCAFSLLFAFSQTRACFSVGNGAAVSLIPRRG